jgi:hypothetical protein
MNTSEMLLTRTLLGLRHPHGNSNRSGRNRTSKSCSNGWSGTPRHRSAKVIATVRHLDVGGALVLALAVGILRSAEESGADS